MSFISKSFQKVLDGAVDTPGHGKDVLDDINAVKKWYLSTCLRMISMPKVDKIYSKRIRVYAMTEKGEVTFSKVCKRLLDLRDEFGTKGDKKYAKCESKSRLKHKY